jgi:hypothetical protein
MNMHSTTRNCHPERSEGPAVDAIGTTVSGTLDRVHHDLFVRGNTA